MPPTIVHVHPVQIIEATAFTSKAKLLFSSNESHALNLLIADNPLCGTPLGNAPGVFILPYAGGIVYYSISPDLLNIYLLDLHKPNDPTPPASKQETSRFKKALGALATGGVIAIGKTGGKWLFEWIKEHFF